MPNTIDAWYGSGKKKVGSKPRDGRAGTSAPGRQGGGTPRTASATAAAPDARAQSDRGDGANDSGGPSNSAITTATNAGENNKDNFKPDGFGKQFNPASYGEAWENPDAVINKWFRGAGISNGSGMQATVNQWAPALGLHWMIGAGDDATKGTGHYLDFAGNYINEMMKPGGDVLTPDHIIKELLNPGSQVLSQHLSNNDLTPAAQVENMRSAMRYGLSNQMPTPVLQAILSQIDQNGRDFVSNRMTNGARGDASFNEYLGSRDFFGY